MDCEVKNCFGERSVLVEKKNVSKSTIRLSRRFNRNSFKVFINLPWHLSVQTVRPAPIHQTVAMKQHKARYHSRMTVKRRAAAEASSGPTKVSQWAGVVKGLSLLGGLKAWKIPSLGDARRMSGEERRNGSVCMCVCVDLNSLQPVASTVVSPADNRSGSRQWMGFTSGGDGYIFQLDKLWHTEIPIWA